MRPLPGPGDGEEIEAQGQRPNQGPCLACSHALSGGALGSNHPGRGWIYAASMGRDRQSCGLLTAKCLAGGY